MKAKHIFITSGVMILGGVWLANRAGALTAQDSSDVQFTFDPTLTLELSSNDISISNLVPGTNSASEPITVTVSTNNLSGYKLSASVGSSSASKYGGTNLVHSTTANATANASATNKFESLATSDSMTLENITAGHWGYTTGNGTNYSGLPAYNASTPKYLVESSVKSAENGDATTFKIGASASSGMAAGDYTNTINFVAITNITTGN